MASISKATAYAVLAPGGVTKAVVYAVLSDVFAPAPESVTPAIGPVAGGTSVTIAGTGFSEGATVTFDGDAAADVVVVSDTEITCTTPAHAAGAVDVVVTNTDEQDGTLADGFTYAAASRGRLFLPV